MGLCESCLAGTHASSNRMHSQKEVLLRDSDSADSFGSYVPPSLRNASAITGADVLSSKEALERQHGGRSFRPSVATQFALVEQEVRLGSVNLGLGNHRKVLI